MGELVGPPEPTISRIQRAFVSQYILPVTDDPLLLEAFRHVDRGSFVLDSHILEAYANKPLPLTPDGSATISQPVIVARMLDKAGLTGTENVLEVGTGSAYNAALISRCAARVTTIERVGTLAEQARINLARYGYDNVQVITGDGLAGWLESAPYDLIIVTGGVLEIHIALVEQLAEGGRLLIPVVNPNRVNTDYKMDILRITRKGSRCTMERVIEGVGFVPLVSDLPGGFGEPDTDAEPDAELTREEVLAGFDSHLNPLGIRAVQAVVHFSATYPEQLGDMASIDALNARAREIIDFHLNSSSDDAKELTGGGVAPAI